MIVEVPLAILVLLVFFLGLLVGFLGWFGLSAWWRAIK